MKPDAAFLDVQTTVAARTGQNPRWIRDGATNRQMEETVRSLLEKALTVDAAVQISVLNNRSLQATFEEIGISQADLVQAGLLKNPQFAASFRFPDRPPSAVNTEYSVADDILDLILLSFRKKIATQQLQQTKLRVSNEVLKLIADVKSAFYTVQAREQLMSRLRIILEANEAAAELSERQHEAGTVNELDMTNQQALYNQTRLELAQAEAQARVDREKLNRFMGVAGARWTVAGQLPGIPQVEFPDEQLESLALTQRLEFAIASNRVALVARALSLRQNTRFLPTGLDIGFSAERDPDRQWVRGPTLELGVPIFDAGELGFAFGNQWQPDAGCDCNCGRFVQRSY
jgi:cobalt-zinc-cadmium efflux system outer membrane protein